MYDSIIIGSGPAGITAGIYMKRAGLNVTIIATEKSNINKNYKIENYYGFKNPISVKELYENGIEQAQNLNIKIVNKEVIGIKYSENNFEIIVENQGIDEKYIAKYVVIATGANRNKPLISGMEKFEGRGISYCAVCDAPFYKNKNVAVLGNGEFAIGEIEELLPIAKKVIMVTNGERAPKNRFNIETAEEEIKEFRGDTKLETIEFKNGMSKKVDGVFIAQGIASSIDLAKKIGADINNNSIKVDNNMETSVKNIYACGDCTGGILQISKATYEGMIAGLAIIKKYREDNK